MNIYGYEFVSKLYHHFYLHSSKLFKQLLKPLTFIYILFVKYIKAIYTFVLLVSKGSSLSNDGGM